MLLGKAYAEAGDLSAALMNIWKQILSSVKRVWTEAVLAMLLFAGKLTIARFLAFRHHAQPALAPSV